MVIFDPPELVVSLKNTMVISLNDSDESYIQKKIGCSDWRLTAGAGLVLQKGANPVLPQSARLSFKKSLGLLLCTVFWKIIATVPLRVILSPGVLTH